MGVVSRLSECRQQEGNAPTVAPTVDLQLAAHHGQQPPVTVIAVFKKQVPFGIP
jgi:hypothetical protein